MKIRNFLHQGLRKLSEEEAIKGVPSNAVDKPRKMVAFFDDMAYADELKTLPFWKPHLLTGDRKRYWSLSVTSHLLLTFLVDETESEICDLNLEDCHWHDGEPMPIKSPPHPGDFIRTEIV